MPPHTAAGGTGAASTPTSSQHSSIALPHSQDRRTSSKPPATPSKELAAMSFHNQNLHCDQRGKRHRYILASRQGMRLRAEHHRSHSVFRCQTASFNSAAEYLRKTGIQDQATCLKDAVDCFCRARCQAQTTGGTERYQLYLISQGSLRMLGWLMERLSRRLINTMITKITITTELIVLRMRMAVGESI